MTVSCCSCCGSGVVVLERGFEFREGALESEADGLLHLVGDLLGELVSLAGSQRPVLNQNAAETRNGIASQGRFVLFALAEDGDGLVLGVVQRNTWGSNDIAVG